MAVLVIVNTIAVGSICSITFAVQFQSEMLRQTESTFLSTRKLLKENINDLYYNITHMMCKPVFKAIYQANSNSLQDKDFLSNYGQINKLFMDLKRNNSWVDSAVLLCKNGTIYSTYNVGLNYHLELFEEEFSQQSICWLPAKSNPLSTETEQVIPVCFPIRYQNEAVFTRDTPPDFMVVVYLKLHQVNTAIQRMNSTAFSHMYLADSHGAPLTLDPKDSLFDRLAQSDIISKIQSSSEQNDFQEIINQKEYRISCQPIQISGLNLVNIASYHSLHQGLKNIHTITFLLVCICTMLALGLAAALSKTITNPILRLVKQVTKVRAGNYDIKPIISQKNELQLMDNAICDMASTIKQQIENIQATEKMRRKAELQAVAEQMNPHFLYNTLDCIHWEILSGHQSNAAEMIESLGKFLRLSLNHGSETLSVMEAIEHTNQYIQLINHRFSSHVRFLFHVSPDVQEIQIPKMILQPLVENSILHGFGGTQPDPAVTAPCIYINGFLEKNAVVLTVEDNGKGFDPKELEQAAQMPSDISGHLALYNVRRRLGFIYGETAQLSFSSIPYYRNQVCIRFCPPQTENPFLSNDKK